MVSSLGDGFSKLIVDSVHGDVHLTKREVRVIDTPSFQRLRQLKQLAMAQMVYPTATHTRFAHSLGALGTMIRILDAAKRHRISIGDEQEENLRLAALLHDIGHYPYSHLMEKVDKVKLTEEQVEGAAPVQKTIYAKTSTYPGHVPLGELIVTGQKDLVTAIGSEDRAKAVADLFTRSKAADPQLSKLIKSAFDIDRWDYLLRDSYATGVPYGNIDMNYLLNNLKVSPQKMVGFSDKALAAIEHFLLARFFMHRVVYYHKTIYRLEEACRQVLKRLRDREGEHYDLPLDGDAVKHLVQSKELHRFTDAFVDRVVRRATEDEDEAIRALARSIQSRRPPILLKEVAVCEDVEERTHKGRIFMQKCKSELKSLAEEFNIPLAQFLLCEPKVTVVKRPEELTYEKVTKMKAEEIRERAFEEEEEDIKVFVGENEEPSSLMEIEHSLVVKYADYVFQMFRLYVVYEGEYKDDVISQLRKKVKDWDAA